MQYFSRIKGHEMKLITKKALLLPALFMTSLSWAEINIDTEQCNMKLNNTLTVTPEHILIKDSDETLVDIYNNKMVFVRGELITLDPMQQALVIEYSEAIRQSIPKLGDIAVDAVDIAYSAISAAIGYEHESPNIKNKFEQLKRQIANKYQNNEGHFTFSNGELNHSMDGDGIDEVVEELMADMMPSIIGSLLSRIGDSMANGDLEISDLENLGERVEYEVESRAEVIEQKAEAFCQDMIAVNQLEDKLVGTNLKLIHLDLIAIEQTN